MYQIITMAIKDLRIMLRDKSGIFFTFIFPIMIAVLFGSIFGGKGDGGTGTITILVVDQDAPEINVVPSSYEAALDRVRLGKSTAYIALRQGFGKASEQMFWGDPPEVEIGVDPARRAEAAMLQGILMKYGSKRFQDAFSNPSKMLRNLSVGQMAISTDSSIDPTLKNNLSQLYTDLKRFFKAESIMIDESIESYNGDSGATEFSDDNNIMMPLRVTQKNLTVLKSGPASAYAISFPQGIIWGIIGVAAAFGVSIVVERNQGTMQRLRIAPISFAQILAGKAAACFLTIVTIDIVLVLIAATVFGVSISSLGLLILAVVSSAICFTGIMMLLSVLGKTERSVSGIGWAVLLVMSMIGGGMIPLMIMPGWMKSIGSISPVKWTILSFEGVMWRGYSLTDMALPVIILLCTGVISFFVGVVVMKKTS